MTLSIQATLTINTDPSTQDVIPFDSSRSDIPDLGDVIEQLKLVKDEIVQRMDAIAWQEKQAQEKGTAAVEAKDLFDDFEKSMDEENAEQAGVDIDDEDLDDSVVRTKKQKTSE